MQVKVRLEVGNEWQQISFTSHCITFMYYITSSLIEFRGYLILLKKREIPIVRLYT